MIPLRWRLTLWHLGLVAAGLMGFILISYQVLSESLRAEIDRTLAERANHVADAVAVVPNRPIEGVSQDTTDEFRSPGIYVQLFDAKGILVAHSFNLGTQQLPVAPNDLQRVLSGEKFYSTTEIDGQPVRLYHQPLARDGFIVGAAQVGQSLAGLELVLGRLRLVYTVGTASILVFALLGGWIVGRFGLRPVARITEAARDVARAEDLSRRVAYAGPADEVGLLATTFNEMLERLQTLFEGQRRFLAEAAHELRTPLASMLGNVDLLSRFGDDPARRTETLSALQRTGQLVARLLDDLLLLAQAEAGWHLELRPLDLDDVVIEVYEEARQSAETSIRLTRCESIQVLGDPDRLRQVFANLIGNAMKQSPPGSAVTLDLWRQDRFACVQVSDNGPGIPERALQHIFDPFFRDPAQARKPGSGLGLSIVRWIVQEHGGEMSVESQPGQGATFTIKLPISPL
ncbi:MAG: HAMP domain-containing sensor histidine kinase [Anaerolineales bacterium]